VEFWWEPRSSPLDYDEASLRQWSAVFRALRWFISNYDGEIIVSIGDVQLPFELRPDLSTVFEPLPDVLEAVGRGEPSELWFFEQGTALKLRLTPRAELVEIAFESGLTAPPEFRRLDATVIAVRRSEFISRWRVLADAVLAELVKLRPALTADPGYRAYRERLARLASQHAG
jgi:hypothetical protein